MRKGGNVEKKKGPRREFFCISNARFHDRIPSLCSAKRLQGLAIDAKQARVGRQLQDSARRAQHSAERERKEVEPRGSLSVFALATIDGEQKGLAAPTPSATFACIFDHVRAEKSPPFVAFHGNARGVARLEDRGEQKKAESGVALLFSPIHLSPTPSAASSELTCAPPLARALVRRPRASLLASRRIVDDSIGAWLAFR